MRGLQGRKVATVFGGSGFIGRYVVQRLAQQDYVVRVAVRDPAGARFLQTQGRVGQIVPLAAPVTDAAAVARAVEGAEAVVHLVGILYERRAGDFARFQGEAPGAVAAAAKAAGAESFVHLSAIGADADSPSLYAQTKAQGEAGVRAAFPDATILRPSVVFGPEDEFFNRFAAMARIAPALPLIGGGQTKFQPVYAGDVGEAIVNAIETGKSAITYELGGPEVATFRELLEFILRETDRKRLLLPLPFPAARGVAFGTEIANKLTFGMLPSMMTLTRDQVTLLQHDNVVSDAARAEGRTIEALGVTPESYEAIVPGYLWRYRATGQFGHKADPKSARDTTVGP